MHICRDEAVIDWCKIVLLGCAYRQQRQPLARELGDCRLNPRLLRTHEALSPLFLLVGHCHHLVWVFLRVGTCVLYVCVCDCMLGTYRTFVGQFHPTWLYEARHAWCHSTELLGSMWKRRLCRYRCRLFPHALLYLGIGFFGSGETSSERLVIYLLDANVIFALPGGGGLSRVEGGPMKPVRNTHWKLFIIPKVGGQMIVVLGLLVTCRI